MSNQSKDYIVEVISIKGKEITFKYKDKEQTLPSTPNAIEAIKKEKLPIKGKIKIRKAYGGKFQISAFEKITRQKKQPRTISDKTTRYSKKVEQPKQVKASEIPRKVNLRNTIAPADTKNLLSHLDAVDNYFLSLTKFAPFVLDNQRKKKFTVFLMDRNDILISNLPKGFDQSVIKVHETIKQISKSMNGVCFKTSISDKLIVGLGEDTINEVGIRLNFTKGFPYIPSTAIKGSFRSFVIEKFFDFNEEMALKDEGFLAIFGGTNDNPETDEGVSGSVIFFDAFPMDIPKIQPDFMTVHFRKYYESKGNDPPTDTDSPNPISFLTVKDTTFQICIALLRKPNITKTLIPGLDSDNFLKKVEELLKKSLSENGLGAKTNIGYGRLETRH